MLKDVTLYFTMHAFTVSVIARNQSGLDKLISSKSESGFIVPLKADYSDSAALTDKILSAINEYGEFETVISWIHSYAESAHELIAGIIGKGSTLCRYFHVKGSGSFNPAFINDNVEQTVLQYKNISYRKIILGFVRENHKSRWLTNTEISNGVIDAVNYDKETFTVGTTEPWEFRP